MKARLFSSACRGKTCWRVTTTKSLILWCCCPDSNGGPTDYESVALPTELQQRRRGRIIGTRRRGFLERVDARIFGTAPLTPRNSHLAHGIARRRAAAAKCRREKPGTLHEISLDE